jgi:hypothetical protein
MVIHRERQRGGLAPPHDGELTPTERTKPRTPRLRLQREVLFVTL